MTLINLVSRAPHSIVKVVGQSIYQTHCGLLTSAFSRFDPTTAVDFGAAWAADNGCFLPGYNPDVILSMLRNYQGIKGCKWIVMPDVVRDASATMLMFQAWLGTYQRYGYPVALAIQNGIEHCQIPWDSITCIFIGGNDEFKYSAIVRGIVTEAKRRGKWVHNGRVNTPERILYSNEIGCDSFDGTHFTREPIDVAKYLPLHIVPPVIAGVARLAYEKVAVEESAQLKLAI